jgi:uncharacterized sodium:solute symporter family permease YidK
MDTRVRIKPYDVKSSVAYYGAGSQVTSQSFGLSLGQTNLLQQQQCLGISAHTYNLEAKLEQLKLSKTDPSTWL